MKTDIFINQAFTDALNLYIANKQTEESQAFWSFPVVVIRSLITIYGELDIINPYRTNNENRMGGFDDNIMKFGFSKDKLQQFKASLQNYQNSLETKTFPNPYFYKIETLLIDMFFCKKKTVTVTDEELQNFQKLLYIPQNQNSIIQQEIASNTNKPDLITRYWQSKWFENNHNFHFMPYKKNTLMPEAYHILGYTLESIAQMDAQTLEQLNNQILSFFKIDVEDPAKDERLREAVTYYKQYGTSMTTGNGYVDMLLLLSMIATIMMTLFAITVKVLGG